ncbi:MAG: hypothetical protein COA44_00635 [Arcobacter sp.]|nr:MAG: hypothetical protein COA44_00635 [Arcobacter sp.]
MTKIKPLVSVFMTSYNQEKYIAQAIESIVDQKCDFLFELVIGEDFSTDGTRAIIMKYQKKYPTIIHTLLRDENVGEKQNSREVLEACSGQYIAFCEGDDFWISSNKLQKEVEILQRDNTIKAVFSQVQYVDSNNQEIGLSEAELGFIGYKKLLQINPIHTCAFTIDKSVYTKSIKEIRRKAPYGDYVMFLGAAYYGKVAYIDEILTAYRRDVGVMHKWSATESGLKRLEIFNLFEEYPEFKEMSFYIKIAKQYLCINLSRHFSDEKQYMQSMKYFILGIYYSCYVFVAKKEEMYRIVSKLEIIKTGIFSFPFVKSIYKYFKGVQ